MGNQEYLYNQDFLVELRKYPVKSYFCRIEVLDWKENLISYIEGITTSCSITINGESSIRRTANISIAVQEDLTNNQVKLGDNVSGTTPSYNSEFKITNPTDLNNLIAVNKKIKLGIGLNNPFYGNRNYQDFSDYGEVLWFNQGIFLIQTVSLSTNESGVTNISLSLVDKMATLNGLVGGTLPASVSFHERLIQKDNGDIEVEEPIIRQIIYEAVQHFGSENASKILIKDLSDTGRWIVEYAGTEPIYLSVATGAGHQLVQPPVGNTTMYPVFTGQKLGYQKTPLTYPGELVFQAGSKVTDVLDAIVKMLGNYQYYYDTDGNFIFELRNQFQETQQTPVNRLNPANAYFPLASNRQFATELSTLDQIQNISIDPDLSKIKNDFICWGHVGKNNDNKAQVRYRLAIDDKPRMRVGVRDVPEWDAINSRWQYNDYTDSLSSYYVWEIQVFQGVDNQGVPIPGRPVRYAFTIANVAPPIDPLLEQIINPPTPPTCGPNSIFGADIFEWREELYRQALYGYGISVQATEYDAELIAEWRKLYDPGQNNIADPETFAYKWNAQRGQPQVAGVAPNSIWTALYGADPLLTGNFGNWGVWTGWNPIVYESPEKVDWWLDIIDNPGVIGQYKVSQIGRRTTVTNNTQVNQVFKVQVPDMVWVPNPGTVAGVLEVIQEYTQIGQMYTLYRPEEEYLFKKSSYYGSCFEVVRSQLFDSLHSQLKLKLTAIPILYLDVNCVVWIDYLDQGLKGWYTIDTISYSLENFNTMSVGLHKTILTDGGVVPTL